MSPPDESTMALSQPRAWPRGNIGGVLGYAGIWAFFGIFLIYPLIRLFYDAFTTDQGVFTPMNFYDFFTDSFYLKTLVNSLLLAVATVILMDYLVLSKPINFMYGIQGVLLVETLHLFPLMTLSIVDALGKISPSLDEAAESVGSRGL